MTSLEDRYQASKKCLPEYLDVFASQEGEDILIRRLLKSRYSERGVYVDVGAHHPLRFSTTAHYYMRGWWGINIEPNEHVTAIFNELRPRDINLNLAVGFEGESDFYMFHEPAFNTFDPEHLEFALTKTELIGTNRINRRPLQAILQNNLPPEQVSELVFFNIDVEGMELEVLKTNDWEVYRPLLVLVEALSNDKLDPITRFLFGVGYQFVARTKNTYFFAEKEFKRCFVD